MALMLLLHAMVQAYGLMGWRVGYIAYPDYDGTDLLGKEFLKCQVRTGLRLTAAWGLFCET